MMVLPKRALFVVIGLMMILAVSACGGTSTSGSAQSIPTTASTPAATPTTASTAAVRTAQVTVNGKATTVLTNARGLTLYSSLLIARRKPPVPEDARKPAAARYYRLRDRSR
jgi:hypothetical protein